MANKALKMCRRKYFLKFLSNSRMVSIKKPEEIKILKEGGRRLAAILKEVGLMVAPGVSAWDLDKKAEALIRRGGDEPAFLNYRPAGGSSPYPASLCVSVNHEVVHGLPTKDKILKNGDIVSIDLGLKHKGLFTDHAVTLAVGKVSPKIKSLLETARQALEKGIKEMEPGRRLGDVGFAIERVISEKKFSIVKELAGHGVGYA